MRRLALVGLILGALALSSWSDAHASRRLSAASQASPLLKDPRGIAVDRHGRVYVVDFGHNRIVKFSPQGKLLAAWGKRGSRYPTSEEALRHWQPEFKNLSDVAVDAHDDVYVTDAGNNRVQKLSPKGALLGIWPCPDGIWVPVDPHNPARGTRKLFPCSDYVGGPYFNLPGGITAAGGNVYVMDYGYRRFEVFDQSGRPRGALQLPTEDSPVKVEMDGSGQIYLLYWRWLDSPPGELESHVRVMDRGGNIVHDWPVPGVAGQPGKNGITDMALDSQGDIYLADGPEGRIVITNGEGKVLIRSSAGTLGWPNGVAVDSHDRVYVTDAWKTRYVSLPPWRTQPASSRASRA